MASERMYECIYCGDFFFEQASKKAEVSEHFQRQYCSPECESTDVEQLKSDAINLEEQALKTPEQANADKVIDRIRMAGGFNVIVKNTDSKT